MERKVGLVRASLFDGRNDIKNAIRNRVYPLVKSNNLCKNNFVQCRFADKWTIAIKQSNIEVHKIIVGRFVH